MRQYMDGKTGQELILSQCDSYDILWGQIPLHRGMPCSHTVSLTRGMARLYSKILWVCHLLELVKYTFVSAVVQEL
jgi:hypothetical protein